MGIKQLILLFTVFGLFSCSSNKTLVNNKTYSDVVVVGAMRDVMWEGKLDGVINLRQIPNKKGLYGLGPVNHLTGEILINDGKAYVSKVLSEQTMTVEESYNVSAPFFVYANVNKWIEYDLPSSIESIKELENYINEKTKNEKRPFALKLTGQIANAVIHIQNLPAGTKVTSPAEAHQGQIKYSIGKKNVEIVGFFSTQHKEVFTHHDSFLHLHMITEDKSKMGHLDEVQFAEMKLFLPEN